MKSLQHENIVRLLDIASSKGCEYVEKNIKVDSNRSEERNEQENNKKKDPVQEYCAKEMKIAASIYLVFEFVEHDLGGLIDARYRFSAKAIKSIAKQLFEVIDFLSERRILHRDIKSSNILITNHHVVKLADFGLARSTIGADGRENKLDLTNNVITMWYKPPELLLGAVKYSTAVDVWSAACVVAELELGRPLFPGKTEVEQADLVFKAIGTPSEDEWPGLTALPCYEQIFKSLTTKYSSNMKSTFSNKLSELMLNLLERILVADPGKRGTAKVALTNKYFYSPPLPPVYPQEMEPINVAAGISYHEYKTKQLRRQKDSEAKIEIKSAEADDPSIDSSINSKVVVNEQASTNLNNPFTYGVDLSRTAQIPRPPVFKPPIPPQSYYPQHQAPIQAPPRMQGLSRQVSSVDSLLHDFH